MVVTHANCVQYDECKALMNHFGKSKKPVVCSVLDLDVAKVNIALGLNR